MRRRSFLALALTAGSAVGATLIGGCAKPKTSHRLTGINPATGTSTAMDSTPLMGSFRLELISRHNIRDRGLGLKEPSGLSLNADGTGLYTVSDDTKAIYCMDLEGRVSRSEMLLMSVLGLEGLALSSDGQQLFVVQEDSNTVISVDLASGRELQHRSLAEMANYASVAMHFPSEPDNKGLEGITVNSTNQHVFVVKEGRPGLLIELDADFSTILSSRLLTTANGFSHPKLGPRKLDFSGLSHDSQRDTLWISSDKGQCLFHYDWNRDQVLQRLDVRLNDGGQSKRVRKAEGIAVDSERGRVYVVSDRDAELYVFQLHG